VLPAIESSPVFQKKNRERREYQGGRLGLAMGRNEFRLDSTSIALVRAGVEMGVAVEYLLPPAGTGNPDAIIMAHHRRHVAHGEYRGHTFVC
jgi:hypothetical protein